MNKMFHTHSFIVYSYHCHYIFSSTGTIYANAHFGQGKGKTWLDNVNCNGHENDLSQCSSPGFGRTTCTHTDDVSVSCFTGMTY